MAQRFVLVLITLLAISAPAAGEARAADGPAASRSLIVGVDRVMAGTATDLGRLLLGKAPWSALEPVLLGHRDLPRTVVVGDSTLWVHGENERIGIGLRLESQTEGVSTRPLIDLLQLFLNGSSRYLPEGEMQLAYAHTRFAAVDVTRKVSLGAWDLWGTASLLAPEAMYRIAGRGMHERGKNVSSYLQFASYTAERGVGYSLGGGLRLRSGRWVVEASGTELAAGIYASGTSKLRGLLNSIREVRDSDGYLVTYPLVTGTMTVEPHVFRPWPKWRIRLEYLRTNKAPVWEAEVRGGGSRYGLAELRAWLREELAVSLGFAFPYAGVKLGVAYGEWELGLTFDPGQTGLTVVRRMVY